MSDYIGNKEVSFPITGKTNPALTEFRGKKFIIPYYIEVPMDTTLDDVYKWVIWEGPFYPEKKKEKKPSEEAVPKVRRSNPKSISLAEPEPEIKSKPKVWRKKKPGVINLGD